MTATLTYKVVPTKKGFEHQLHEHKDGKIVIVYAQKTNHPKITKHQMGWIVKNFFRANPQGKFISSTTSVDS